jgi:hypothetical protein
MYFHDQTGSSKWVFFTLDDKTQINESTGCILESPLKIIESSSFKTRKVTEVFFFGKYIKQIKHFFIIYFFVFDPL